MATTRAIWNVLETYQRARITFAHTIAELATKPQNVEVLHNAEVMQLLGPLLLDSVPQVQQNAALALGRLANYSEDLAAALVCYCLSSIAKHSTELAEVVVAADVFPKIFVCLKDADPQVRRNAATVIREVAKHTPKLAQLIVGVGGVVALVDNVADTFGNERLPGIMALGYIAAFDEALATTIIVSSGISPILDALTNEKEDHIKSASAWSLGQIGRHGSTHALAVAEAGVLPSLVSTFLAPTSSEDLQNKCKRALKALTEQLTHFPALDSLLQGPILSEGILKYVLAQLARILPSDANARTQFVTSGGFEKVQHLRMEPGSDLKEYIEKINGYYPIEIVHYYSPGYSETLLQRLIGSPS